MRILQVTTKSFTYLLSKHHLSILAAMAAYLAHTASTVAKDLEEKVPKTTNTSPFFKPQSFLVNART